MRLKKYLLLSAKILAAAAIFTGLYFFCGSQTKGFRPYLILSNLPNDPQWEMPPLSNEEQKRIGALLDQPFTLLGSGGWCYAFLGQDQKTVLKFYRHDHLRPLKLLSDFSFGKLLLKTPSMAAGSRYFQEFNFRSCSLIYKEAQERTGLIYVHLNKTDGLYKPVTLIDNIGIRHTIDLDKTEFLVQKKAELLIPHIARLAEQSKIEEAKQSLDDILECLLTIYKSGARDYDKSLRNNFGYTEDGAIALDLSSFGVDESMKKPGEYRKEIVMKTRRLSHYLRKYQPELYLYFTDRLNEIVEKG